MHKFDQDELSAYLAVHLPEFKHLDEIERFGGGQSNPTYKIVSGSKSFVLRARHTGKLLSSAHRIDRECRLLSALENTAVPAPKVYHLSGAENPLGTMFYVMENLDGRIFWDPALPNLDSSERVEVYDQICSVLAILHDIDPNAIGLRDFGTPGSYFTRQIARWTKQYRDSVEEQDDDMETLIRWLRHNEPEDDGQVSIVHGDFRIDNFVFSKDTGQIIGILDWELCTLGHPFADLAYFCMCLRLPEQGLIKGLGAMNRADLGISTEAQFVESYCKKRGIDPPANWTFALAFSFFRLIAIAIGVISRAKQGNASNPANLPEMQLTFRDLKALALNVIGEGSID